MQENQTMAQCLNENRGCFNNYTETIERKNERGKKQKSGMKKEELQWLQIGPLASSKA